MNIYKGKMVKWDMKNQHQKMDRGAVLKDNTTDMSRFIMNLTLKNLTMCDKKQKMSI